MIVSAQLSQHLIIVIVSLFWHFINGRELTTWSNGTNQRTLAVWGRITVQLVSSLTGLELTNEGTIILFVFSEAV